MQIFYFVYVGQWQYDRKHGQGHYTWANGRTLEGKWENGNEPDTP